MPPVYSKEWNRVTIATRGDARQSRTSPCEAACPLGNGIQQLHTLIEKNDINTALDVLFARNPFPGVTGRVCPHPCETHCNRAQHDEALSICALERFAADNGHVVHFQRLPESGKRLAIVGAGPAGLTAAYFAHLLGHSVVVYESAPVMGGVPRHVVPDFRLPKDVVDAETGRIVAAGVQVRTNVVVGKDITIPALLQAYDAVVLAVGLWKERLLDIPGKEHLVTAVGWLKRTTLERQSLAGSRVIILGGGGVAFDCAFTARRLGATAVHVVCLEPAHAMCAPVEEVKQAHEEGIFIHNSQLSQSVIPFGDGLRFAARPVTHFHFDEKGAVHVDYAENPPLELDADLIICASGLQTEETALKNLPLARTPRGFVDIDPATGRTSIERLYAAGDIALGPSLIAQAIGHGRQVAIALHKHFAKLLPEDNLDVWIDAEGQVHEALCPAVPVPHVVTYDEIMHTDYHAHGQRLVQPLRKEQSVGDLPLPPALPFDELCCGCEASATKTEAARCMHCGHCMHCGSCVESCPGHILEMTEDGPVVAHPEQCWHCGCCRIACPTGSIAYKFPLTMLL